MSLQEFYAGYGNPSYLHSNIEKTTNVSPEFYKAAHKMLMYYVDREGEYKDDLLYVNIGDTLYPLTCVDNPALYPGLYIETVFNGGYGSHYKVSNHNIAEVMQRYPRFVVRSSQRYNPTGDRCDFSTAREIHEQSCSVVSLQSILAQQTASKELVDQLQTIKHKDDVIASQDELIAALNARVADLVKSNDQLYSAVSQRGYEPVRESSMGFKEAAGLAATSLSLIKLGLSVGKELRR